MLTIDLTLMIRTNVFHEILLMQSLSYISEQKLAESAHYLVKKYTMWQIGLIFYCDKPLDRNKK